MTEEELGELRLRVLVDSEIKNRSARFLYLMLLRECDGGSTCSPSIQRLMDLTTMSHQEIQTFLRSLEDQGFVISTPSPDKTGPDETNEYFLPRLQEALEAFAAATHRKR